MKEPQRELKWPLRVERVILSYNEASKQLSKTAGKKISVSYIPESLDLHERIWEFRASLKPDTVKTTVNSIYRIRHKNESHKDEQFYFYSCTKSCHTANNQLAVFTYDRYGWHRSPVLGLDHSVENRAPQPKVVGYKHCFWLPWNKEEVKKLLDSSDIKMSAVLCRKFCKC